MPACLFVSDLHGRRARYDALWRLARAEAPAALFLGGDLLPHAMDGSWRRPGEPADFITAVLVPGFAALRDALGERAPRVFLIPGNDDPRAFAPEWEAGQADGLWEEIHGRVVDFGPWRVAGYACIPPSPFQLKDWERYDVSRFVDPGCIPPEEGSRTAGPAGREIVHTTIAAELEELAGAEDPARLILLAHCPPYGGALDRADLDGRAVDHVPLDVHVGSIALQRFIAARSPRLTLHGHVHESTRLTGAWRENTGPTVSVNAAHDGPELAVVRFDPDDPDGPAAMTRELVQSAVNGSS